MNRKCPIGLFDSGFGGLTVLSEVFRLLPQEDVIYLGDTAHLPYGDKSPATVQQFALDNSAFLLERNIKLLIVACHTACAHALALLQKKLPIPVIGVIQPGLELSARFERIAILATRSTIESGLYQNLLGQQNPASKIYPKACPLFVPLVEEGLIDHPATFLIAESYLASFRNEIDAALLACTHYPLLKTVLQRVLGPQVALLEPAERCALQARLYLAEASLLNSQKGPPTHQFFVTDAPEKFQREAKTFLGGDVAEVKKAQLIARNQNQKWRYIYERDLKDSRHLSHYARDDSEYRRV